MDYSDPLFISSLRENDANAWEHFYADSYERLRRKAFAICGAATPEADIEDIVQDTFKAAFEGIGTFRGDSALHTWLIAILVNRCRLYYCWRKLRRMIPLVPEHVCDLTAEQGQALYREARFETFHGCLSDLAASETPGRRATIQYILVLFSTGREIPSRKEMASEWHCSENTATARWRRAIREIRRILRRRQGDMDQ